MTACIHDRPFLRFLCAATLALCSLAAWAQPVDLLARARAAGVIRVANTQASPPWTYLDEKNQPAGYDIEIARELTRRIGVPRIEFVADLFKNFVEGLKTGKYELVLNDLTPTVERMKQVDFGSPYGVEDFRIFVKSSNTDIKDKPDLRGKRIGVTAGTSNESWSRANLTESVIVVYDNGGLVFNDLSIGRVDAVISSHFGGMRYLTVNKLPIKEVGPVLTYQLSAPAMPKGQDALRAAVNAAIAEMHADGTINRLSKRWVDVPYEMSTAVAEAQKAP